MAVQRECLSFALRRRWLYIYVNVRLQSGIPWVVHIQMLSEGSVTRYKPSFGREGRGTCVPIYGQKNAITSP